MNYYPFHIGDFRSGTVHMSRLARWIYRDMMDVYYDSEKPLTLDFEALCDQIGVESTDERAVVQKLLRFKFIQTEDGYRHDICDSVIAEYRVKAETAKSNGKLAAAARYKGGEYMAAPGSLYAVRINPDLVKVGISANMRSRLNQLRSKYGKHVAMIHQVPVSHMGNAEAELLQIYEETRSGEEVPVPVASEHQLKSHMDQIGVAYTVASVSHGGSHTNQEPITNNHIKTSSSGQSPDKQTDAESAGGKTEKKPKYSDEDTRCAEWIFERILKTNPKQSPPRFPKWADEVRLLREAKQLTHREICEMFDWTQADTFWKSNILSPAKLRDKWDQLTIKRGSPQKGQKHDNFATQDYRAGVGADGSF
nr:YdaU family protein [uncultured Duganella sp.]